MCAQILLVALFSWFIVAGAIGSFSTERFSRVASQLNIPQLIPNLLAHRGSGRIGAEPEQMSFAI